MNSILNALTIDVEEHFQVHAFETVVERSAWDHFPSRVVANTQRILRLLAEYEVRATFFVLGWVADRYPDLVKQIAISGHEIATHGYWHELVYRQTPDEFAADLCQSLGAIGRAFNGLQPAGYRAPSFSITHQSLWALDILRDHRILYDSSIFPLAAHDRYGIKDAHRFANKTWGGLWEFPVSTIRLGKQNWPVAGGGYFRLFPLWITRQAIRQLNAPGHPAVIYLHPWEFDPDQPRIPDAPVLSRFRHYVNIHKTESRLRALLKEFKFAPMCEVFAGSLEVG
ncbi:MAG TPA: XrtA system polysaccharide deacetylase [Anaerolineae bacterium]|nr:XrtA system polysaccharide deacetylase [Anaerolineae bacterium]